MKQMVPAGQIAEVARYCESDVVDTYRVWLVYELFRGAITKEQLGWSETQIRDFVLRRGLAEKIDRRKDVRLDQSQSPLGSRLRALRYDRRRFCPPRHDPHHAQAARCKHLVMNSRDRITGSSVSGPTFVAARLA